ncbi:GreA/GreB family elongation factor [uncultured Meiothermus sp.]|jgi:transcription elongation factor GreB|uniref:GreA/GreB family elongation factor n=1 Tax=uncultured Meiothermus sp. TaxID=157471 RepID=UPI00260841CF|nr:GreA/GreB family elongation factor [uncultured Meiothermus sp.]
MSRAFVKEDASSGEVAIPARAPLPAGIPNYVTPRGLALLQDEHTALLNELGVLQKLDGGPALALVRGKLELLEERLSSAKLVDPHTLPQDEIQIGATVTLLAGQQERRLTIVGVDEANLLEGRVAFTAPIAQTLLGRRVAEEAVLETAKGKQVLRIIKIEYAL